ncbi:MAG: DUF2157 domain-containing protein [Magnetococcales bacterium]|nr:DUF2157 domain-containing protein [Magnetococcales bacterium]
MSKQVKRLQEWVALGLISQEQADQIQRHEENRPATSWVLTAFMSLGAFVIGIGVISLVAANWQDIPDGVKLGADLLLLIALAIAIVQTHGSPTKPWLPEKLLVGFLLLCMASIGLISQIYHTGGKLEEALLFWCLITLPASTLSRRDFIPFGWTTLFLGAGFTWIMTLPMIENHPDPESVWVGFFLAAPLASALMARLLESTPKAKAYRNGFHFYALVGGLLGIMVVDVFGANEIKTITLETLLPGFLLGGLLLVSLTIRGDINRLQRGILALALLLYMALFPTCLLWVKWPYMDVLFTLTILGLMALHLGSTPHNRPWFHLLVFLMGLRFLGIYFEALEGLAATGVGLIVSGTLIIGLLEVWRRYTKIWQRKLEGLGS